MTKGSTAFQILKLSTEVLKRAWPGHTVMHVTSAVPKPSSYNRTYSQQPLSSHIKTYLMIMDYTSS